MHRPAPALTEPGPEHGGNKTVRQSYRHEEARSAEVCWSWKETRHKPRAAPPSGAGGNSTCTNGHNFPSPELCGRFMSVWFIIMLHNLHIESNLLDASARFKKQKQKTRLPSQSISEPRRAVAFCIQAWPAEPTPDHVCRTEEFKAF